MCGIAGIVAVDELDQDAPARAMRMRDVITHRGPDEAGLHCDAHAALAHRRLSIVDLSTGQQPLSNEDGSVWVVFNGEIYNHADVRNELEAHGHTLPHQVRHRNHRPRLRAVGRRLRAPLPRHVRVRHLGRAEAPPAARARPARRQAALLDPHRRRAALRLGDQGDPRERSDRAAAEPRGAPRSAQHALHVRRGDAVPRHPQAAAGPSARLRRRRRSRRGSTGTFPMRGSTGASSPLSSRRPRRAFPRAARGIGPPAPDERRAARHVPLRRHRQQRHRRAHGADDRPAAPDVLGGLQGSRVQRARVRARGGARRSARSRTRSSSTTSDFFGALPKLVWHEDEPIAHPSSVPLYFVSALARQHVTVVLTGEGSDELLAGYGKYPRVAWNWRAGTVYERMVPAALRASIARGVVPRLPRQARPLRARSFLAMDRSPESMFFDNFASIRLADQQTLLAPALRDAATRAGAYGRRSDTSTSRTARARCSIGCSTPTSRPTWSSC